MPEITDRQLIAAVSKAVEVGLLPRSACGEDYLANYEKVRAVLEAARTAGGSWNDRAETPYAGLVRAAERDLPEGWVIITEVERGGWSVCLVNPKGQAEPFDLIHDDVEGQFSDALSDALMRAVEPKP